MLFLLIRSIAYREPKLKMANEEDTGLHQIQASGMCRAHLLVFQTMNYGVISGPRNDFALAQNKN
jgi:hypothetical protein